MTAVKKAPDRAPGYEGCPGCIDVDLNGLKCAPGDLSRCTAVQFRNAGWKPGKCAGCIWVQHLNHPCASGNAQKCAVGWMRAEAPRRGAAPVQTD